MNTSEKKFFNYIGQPATLIFDEDGFPDTCLMFDPKTKEYSENDHVLYDLQENPHSIEISEEEHQKLCAVLILHETE